MADWLKKANEMLGDIAGQAGRQAEILQLQAKLGSLDNDLERVYIEAGKRAEELVQQRQVLDEELRVILRDAGFADVRNYPLTLGITRLYVGRKGQ